MLLSISLLILISMHQIHFDTMMLLLIIPLIYCYNFRENIVFNRRLFKEKTILSIISSIIAVSLSPLHSWVIQAMEYWY